MKILKSIHFLATLAFILPQQLLRTSAAPTLPSHNHDHLRRCADTLDPLDPSKRTFTSCNYVKAKRDIEIGITSNENKDEDKNMFEILGFRCTSSDNTTCDNVKNAFKQAGEILSKVLKLNKPVKVNMTYLSFCKELNDCPTKTIHLGSAAASRFILMGDDDGINRYYPQALVKQFDLDDHPEFLPADIVANFNSEVKWYFDGKDPIKSNEMEFLAIILHELVHGLGFKSDWGSWIGRNATISYPTLISDPSNETALIFTGFMELCFDRYLVLLDTGYPELDKKPATEVTKELNTFSKGPGTKFSSVADFILEFVDSKQFKLAQKMYNVTTKAKTLGFLANGERDPIFLETSYNPLVTGTSIVHVDQSTYENSTDFLMKALFYYGVTLEQKVKESGDTSYGPIGPLLRKILETMGYQTVSGGNSYEPSEAKDQGFPTKTFDDLS